MARKKARKRQASDNVMAGKQTGNGTQGKRKWHENSKGKKGYDKQVIE